MAPHVNKVNIGFCKASSKAFLPLWKYCKYFNNIDNSFDKICCYKTSMIIRYLVNTYLQMRGIHAVGDDKYVPT